MAEITLDKSNLSFFKILVAVGDTSVRHALQEILEETELQFECVGTADEAFEALRGNYFDLLLLEIPRTAPAPVLEAVRSLRSGSERFAKIPVFGWVEEGSPETVAEVRAAGLTGCFEKTANRDELVKNLHVWTREIYEGLPVLDLKSLDKILMFDDEQHSLLLSLFQIYSENTQEELFKMRDLIQDGDMEKLRKKAHMLKSSAAQLGALRFEKFCILMEYDTVLTAPRAKILHSEMCKEYENSRQKFASYCQNLGQIPNVLI